MLPVRYVKLLEAQLAAGHSGQDENFQRWTVSFAALMGSRPSSLFGSPPDFPVSHVRQARLPLDFPVSHVRQTRLPLDFPFLHVRQARLSLDFSFSHMRQARAPMTHFAAMAPELLANIFSFLEYNDLAQGAFLVCTTWNTAASHIWRMDVLPRNWKNEAAQLGVVRQCQDSSMTVMRFSGGRPDAALTLLTPMPSLQHLRLDRWEDYNSSYHPHLCSRIVTLFPSLIQLELRNCTIGGLQALTRISKTLRHLQIWYDVLCNDWPAWEKFSRLTHLDIAPPPATLDFQGMSFGPTLRTLCLGRIDEDINDEIIENWLQRWPHSASLTSLSLKGEEGSTIESTALDTLLAALSGLKQLSLQCLPAIPAPGRGWFAALPPLLESLTITFQCFSSDALQGFSHAHLRQLCLQEALVVHPRNPITGRLVCSPPLSLKPLEDLPSLSRLDLSDANVADDLPRAKLLARGCVIVDTNMRYACGTDLDACQDERSDIEHEE